jgi:hypothetical protein
VKCRRVDPGGFHDASVAGDIAEEHRQPAIGVIRVGNVADAAAFLPAADTLRLLRKTSPCGAAL